MGYYSGSDAPSSVDSSGNGGGGPDTSGSPDTSSQDLSSLSSDLSGGAPDQSASLSDLSSLLSGSPTDFTQLSGGLNDLTSLPGGGALPFGGDTSSLGALASSVYGLGGAGGGGGGTGLDQLAQAALGAGGLGPMAGGGLYNLSGLPGGGDLPFGGAGAVLGPLSGAATGSTVGPSQIGNVDPTAISSQLALTAGGQPAPPATTAPGGEQSGQTDFLSQIRDFLTGMSPISAAHAAEDTAQPGTKAGDKATSALEKQQMQLRGTLTNEDRYISGAMTPGVGFDPSAMPGETGVGGVPSGTPAPQQSGDDFTKRFAGAGGLDLSSQQVGLDTADLGKGATSFTFAPQNQDDFQSRFGDTEFGDRFRPAFANAPGTFNDRFAAAPSGDAAPQAADTTFASRYGAAPSSDLVQGTPAPGSYPFDLGSLNPQTGQVMPIAGSSAGPPSSFTPPVAGSPAATNTADVPLPQPDPRLPTPPGATQTSDLTSGQRGPADILGTAFNLNAGLPGTIPSYRTPDTANLETDPTDPRLTSQMEPPGPTPDRVPAADLADYAAKTAATEPQVSVADVIRSRFPGATETAGPDYVEPRIDVGTSPVVTNEQLMHQSVEDPLSVARQNLKDLYQPQTTDDPRFTQYPAPPSATAATAPTARTAQPDTTTPGRTAPDTRPPAQVAAENARNAQNATSAPDTLGSVLTGDQAPRGGFDRTRQPPPGQGGVIHNAIASLFGGGQLGDTVASLMTQLGVPAALIFAATRGGGGGKFPLVNASTAMGGAGRVGPTMPNFYRNIAPGLGVPNWLLPLAVGAQAGQVLDRGGNQAPQQASHTTPRSYPPVAPAPPAMPEGTTYRPASPRVAGTGAPIPPQPVSPLQAAQAGAQGGAVGWIQQRGGHSAGEGAPPLDPVFASRVQQAAMAYEAETGRPARFGETGRSYEQQKIYHDRFLRGEGGLAAKEGTSRHEKGLAIDIPDRDFQNWMHRNAARFGLEGLRDPRDPDHFQMASA